MWYKLRRRCAILVLLPVIVFCLASAIWILVGPYEYEHIVWNGTTYSAGRSGHIVEFPPYSVDQTIEVNITALEGTFDFFVMDGSEYYKWKKNQSYIAFYEESNLSSLVHIIQIGEEWIIHIRQAPHNGNYTISGRIVAKCWGYTGRTNGGYGPEWELVGHARTVDEHRKCKLSSYPIGAF
jgi:hypothetical protein